MDRSLEERIAALEARFAALDEARRAVIPDEVWDTPEIKAARAHNQKNFFECLKLQAGAAQQAIEAQREEVAERGNEYEEFGALIQVRKAEGVSDDATVVMESMTFQLTIILAAWP
jgi:hypothetical protein